MKKLSDALNVGTNIFNPQAKVIANVDRVIEFIETGNAAPILVEVDPSNACNQACSFCLSSYIHFDKAKGTETFSRALMPRDMLMNLCKDFVEMGVRAINWTGGGEPTLNKHLKEAIQYCGQNGIKMGIFTNGVLFDKWDLFETMVDNMTWVRFSVDAGTKETYDEVRKSKKNQGWDKMAENLNKLIEVNNKKGKKIDIGIGYVISPDNCHEVVEFAEFFSKFDLSYCQYKPEIVIREIGGIQRDIEFWEEKVEPKLREAKEILGDKFEINGYKLDDLENDRKHFGRNYKKCLGSQIQPCVGADGHVYVCTNHRGWKQYSYGCLYDGKSFKDIWNDIESRRKVMHQIEEVECFSKCTQLCKPHESNKAVWEIWKNMGEMSATEKRSYVKSLNKMKEEVRKNLEHIEFI
jgi:wyosine [tRNA(Phe)-imidazoG37] synthetase (radical SAM superfamily)